MFNLYYNAFKKELMNIVLIGYMGSGKSLIGSHLAKKVDYKFIDLDQYIEKNETCSISKIFEDSGDIYFRKIETKYLIKCLSENNNIVLSLGGGTPCYNDNLTHINSANNISIYLKNNNVLIRPFGGSPNQEGIPLQTVYVCVKSNSNKSPESNPTYWQKDGCSKKLSACQRRFNSAESISYQKGETISSGFRCKI